jgi:hypothetical protein
VTGCLLSPDANRFAIFVPLSGVRLLRLCRLAVAREKDPPDDGERAESGDDRDQRGRQVQHSRDREVRGKPEREEGNHELPSGKGCELGGHTGRIGRSQPHLIPNEGVEGTFGNDMLASHFPQITTLEATAAVSGRRFPGH